MKKISTLFLVAVLIFTFTLPLKINANIQLFEDIPTSHPNREDVFYLNKKKVIESEGSFRFNDVITREEMVVMIAKARNLSGTSSETKFNDIPKSHDNSGFIQSAVDAGIVNGITATKFEPNGKLKRGQLAILIARAYELPEGTATFRDMTSNHYAHESAQKLIAANIVTGYPDGTFKPNLEVTRIYAAAVLARAMQYADSE